jgi:hypothetical protein
MVSWQSVEDLRVMEYEAENAMAGKSSGFNELIHSIACLSKVDTIGH